MILVPPPFSPPTIISSSSVLTRLATVGVAILLPYTTLDEIRYPVGGVALIGKLPRRRSRRNRRGIVAPGERKEKEGTENKRGGVSQWSMEMRVSSRKYAN